MGERISILGDGGWGTALALLLHQKGHAVKLWGAFPDYIEKTRAWRENKLYLPGVQLPHGVVLTADRAEAVRDTDLFVLAVPTRFFRAVLTSFAGLLDPQCRLVSVAKGFDPETRERMTQVAASIMPRAQVAALSGPSHAEEVARGMPTAVVAASASQEYAVAVQQIFSGARFRVYTSDDVVGVELGGALKNVIALATGISDGLGFGDNTRAALITRGLAEMSRLGLALGAKAPTFAGLSGIGDLIVTCASKLSRNHAVGERLGRGETIDHILGSMKQVAEGVGNCAIARDIAAQAGIQAPITDQVYHVLHSQRSPLHAVEALMTRDHKPE